MPRLNAFVTRLHCAKCTVAVDERIESTMSVPGSCRGAVLGGPPPCRFPGLFSAAGASESSLATAGGCVPDAWLPLLVWAESTGQLPRLGWRQGLEDLPQTRHSDRYQCPAPCPRRLIASTTPLHTPLCSFSPLRAPLHRPFAPAASALRST